MFIQPPITPDLRQDQKAATRARILATARSHFETYGFDGTNIRTIAAEIGVASGTVLLHFPDKIDLLNSALFDDLDATCRLALAAPATGPLEHDLLALARTFFGYYERRPKLSRTLLKEALLAQAPWASKFSAQVTQVHGHAVTLIEAARARGEVAKDTDASVLAASFFAFYYFALIAWVQESHPRPLALIETLFAQHLAGARPRRKKTPRTRRKP